MPACKASLLSRLRRCASGAALCVVAMCGAALADPQLTSAERLAILSLSLDRLKPAPADLTNAAIGNPAAMALGATLFFDTRMSRNGEVACSTCHKIDQQFQDGLPLGKGIGTMNRRTQPLAGVAWQRWFFWDGRKDSLWSQALAPLEKSVEHGLTRTSIAHFIAASFRDRYERIFGPMPDLSAIPADASPVGTGPQRVAWAALSPSQQHDVNLVFANVGKAIAAFETSLTFPETRFDRFAKALAGGAVFDADHSLTDAELEGLKLFVGKGRCMSCHNGPRFTNDGFNNTGVPPGPGQPPDPGRADGVTLLYVGEFSCRGSFNAAPAAYCADGEDLNATGFNVTGAFKVPSLRGVAKRPPYMHAGQFATLEDVLAHYRAAPQAKIGRSALAPLEISDAETQALMAFLKTLD